MPTASKLTQTVKTLKIKPVVKIPLAILAILILLYQPMLRMSGFPTRWLTIAAVLIFAVLCLSLVSNLYQKNRAGSLLDLSLLVSTVILPVVILLVALAFPH